MKSVKNNCFFKCFITIAPIIFLFIGSISAMENPVKQPLSASITKYQEPRLVGNEIVWVKTSDDRLVEMFKWQIDQMKVLQILLINQRGANSKDNPIDLLVLKKEDGSLLQITETTLNFLKTALEMASNGRELFQTMFWDTLTKEEQSDLINGAFELEALGLAALLAEMKFPVEVQQKLGARFPNTTGASIIEPVISYLLKETVSRYSLAIPIKNIQFSPDSNYLIGFIPESGDGPVFEFFDFKTGTSKFINSDSNYIKFSRTGKYIVTRYEDTFRLWNGEYPTLLFMGNLNPAHKMSSLDINVNEDYLIAVPENKNYLILIAIGDILRHLPIQLIGHVNPVNFAQFSPNGKYIISGSSGFHKNLILWNVQTKKMIRVLEGSNSLEGHETDVVMAVFSSDGEYIVSVDKNNIIILWNATTGKFLGTLENDRFNWKEYTLQFLGDNKYIGGFAHGSGFDILWDVKTKKIINAPQFPISTFSSYGVTKNNWNLCSNCNFITTWAEDNNVVIYHLRNIQEHIEKMQKPFGIIAKDLLMDSNQHVKISPDCRHIICGPNGFNQITLSKLEPSFQMILNLPYEGIFLDSAFSPDNNYIAILVDKELFLWKMTDLEAAINFIRTKLTITQARFLYRLYIGRLNNVPVVIDKNDPDYAIYKSFDEMPEVKRLIDKIFRLNLSSDF